MLPSDLTAEYFSTGYNCAQSVLHAFAEDLGIDFDTATRISGSFGGGMGRSGGPCGAVTGALMALSLSTASPDPLDKETKERNYALTRQFVESFEARFGSSTCPGLLGVCIGTYEGRQTASQQGLFKTRCPEYVQGAAEILAEMLAEKPE